MRSIENSQNNLNQELSWKKLQSARTLSVPFQLTLTENEEPLCCIEIIRIVPHKRLVAFAKWKNKLVVAKLFYERGKAKRHCNRDAAGIKALMSANIPTPALLYQGSAHKKAIHVLIFEKISSAVSLDDVWRDKLDLSEALPLLRGVILELATQHVLGILQRDLHLKNFLVTQRKIYTLDGASITTFGEPLDKKISLANLGLFFAQLGVGTDDLQEDFFKYYAKLRGWPIKNSDLTTLRSIVIQSNQKRQQRFQKKVLRNCTAFSKTKTSKQWMMQDRGYLSSEFTQFLKNPDKAFSTASHLLKAGRTTSVAKIKINNHLFVVKRYNIKNSLHALRRCLRETRAVTSWRLAQQLRLFCIPTAKPVACIEYRFLGLRSKSYFIMEYIEGPHLGNYFSRYRYGDAEAEKVAERVVNLFKNLGELRMTHGDLKMTNILVANNHPVLIDLDGMIAHRSAASFRRAFKKEINRFMKNWEDQPDVYALFDGLVKKL